MGPGPDERSGEAALDVTSEAGGEVTAPALGASRLPEEGSNCDAARKVADLGDGALERMKLVDTCESRWVVLGLHEVQNGSWNGHRGLEMLDEDASLSKVAWLTRFEGDGGSTGGRGDGTCAVDTVVEEHRDFSERYPSILFDLR